MSQGLRVRTTRTEFQHSFGRQGHEKKKRRDKNVLREHAKAENHRHRMTREVRSGGIQVGYRERRIRLATPARPTSGLLVAIAARKQPPHPPREQLRSRLLAKRVDSAPSYVIAAARRTTQPAALADKRALEGIALRASGCFSVAIRPAVRESLLLISVQTRSGYDQLSSERTRRRSGAPFSFLVRLLWHQG